MLSSSGRSAGKSVLIRIPPGNEGEAIDLRDIPSPGSSVYGLGGKYCIAMSPPNSPLVATAHGGTINIHDMHQLIARGEGSRWTFNLRSSGSQAVQDIPLLSFSDRRLSVIHSICWASSSGVLVAGGDLGLGCWRIHKVRLVKHEAQSIAELETRSDVHRVKSFWYTEHPFIQRGSRGLVSDIRVVSEGRLVASVDAVGASVVLWDVALERCFPLISAQTWPSSSASAWWPWNMIRNMLPQSLFACAPQVVSMSVSPLGDVFVIVNRYIMMMILMLLLLLLMMLMIMMMPMMPMMLKILSIG